MNIRCFIIQNILLVCSVFTITGNECTAQLQVNENGGDLNSRFIEKLYIHTDRDIYISGEDVWIKIYKLDGLTGSPDNFSKVVYLELLDRKYNPVSQIKTLITESSGSAVINLSDTLSTGDYLLCAYTRWMLNFPGNRNIYKPVYIINPFKKIDYVFPEEDSLEVNRVATVLPEGNSTPGPEMQNETNNAINIEVSTLRDHYSEREDVIIDISVKDLQGNPVNADMSVSVIGASLGFDKGVSDFDGFLPDTIDCTFREIPENMPELEGEIITGTLRDKVTGEPVKKAELSFSFVGKRSRSQFYETDNEGRFVFVVGDQFGLGEMVIQPLSQEFNGAYVDLDQPFSTVSDEFNFRFPQIDSARLEGINKAIVSMQVNTIYRQSEKLVTKTDSSIVQNFYGETSRRVHLSEYIDLKNIREVIREILPDVKVIKRNKEVGLKVMNDNPFEIFTNMSLVLIDGVPIMNVEALLDVDAGLFEIIDIINTRYFFKRSVFEGIVSFITKKGNLDVLDYENFFFRQVYEGFSRYRYFESPDYSSDSLKATRIPDFRNTIYWNPDLRSGDTGKAQVRFYTSDEKGEYTVVVEGITANGNYGIKKIPFRIE